MAAMMSTELETCTMHQNKHLYYDIITSIDRIQEELNITSCNQIRKHFHRACIEKTAVGTG